MLEAFNASDEDALKALGEKDKPDPWLVADELFGRGEHRAAEAFARAAPRKAVEKLPDYVVSRCGIEPDTKAREALAVINKALAKREWPKVVASAQDVSGPLDSVVRVRVAYGHGMALRSLWRLEESEEVLRQAAKAARGRGWLTRAAMAFHQAGWSADFASAPKRAVQSWTARLDVVRALGDQAGVVQALSDLGNVQRLLGNCEAALAHLEEAVALGRQLGDPAGVARALAGRAGWRPCVRGFGRRSSSSRWPARGPRSRSRCRTC